MCLEGVNKDAENTDPNSADDFAVVDLVEFQQQSNFEAKVRLEGVYEDAEINKSDPNYGEKYLVEKYCLEREEDPNSEEYSNAHGGGSRSVNSVGELRSKHESAGVHIDKYQSADYA